MSDKIKETDKDVLRRIMSEPTFATVREAAIRENAERKKGAVNFLRQAAAAINELPEEMRSPLHSLQADLDYLVARIRKEDDEVVGMLKDSIRERLSQIESAAYRLANPRTP